MHKSNQEKHIIKWHGRDVNIHITQSITQVTDHVGEYHMHAHVWFNVDGSYFNNLISEKADVDMPPEKLREKVFVKAIENLESSIRHSACGLEVKEVEQCINNVRKDQDKWLENTKRKQDIANWLETMMDKDNG
ncbi:hypothetical protein LCGC14_0479780 [marine sediment metagenome]|uniref:Uncharacterized protein n=1 Tax=marine sediment metagenome TaxID=412755 RepID=A0A0F9SSX0_9ZZZZ